LRQRAFCAGEGGENKMALRIVDGKQHYDCFLCSRPFQYGEGIYKGRHIPQWNVQLCDFCLASNSDGIVPEAHPSLIRHLKASGAPYELNPKGWLVIPHR
jgi:hypothetical protein